MKKVVKFMLSNINLASRNKREINVLVDMGYEVIAFYEDESVVDEICKDGYRIVSFQPNKFSALKLFRFFQIISRWIRISYQLRSFNADCISCHGMFGTLIGWMSTWLTPKDKKALLVYDSHEYELEFHKHRNKLNQFILCKLEKFLIYKSAFTMEVNDSIADEVQKNHKLKKRPIVVRNIPNYWNIDNKMCKLRKQEFCDQLGISINAFIIMYHGYIKPNRGLEILFKALQRTENVYAVVLGNGNTEYFEKLKKDVKELQLTERVLFIYAVNINILWQYIGASNVGISLAPNTSMNHYFMLPNKLFENIQACTPIIASNFPEIRRIIEKYNVGLLVNPEDTEEIVNAIESIRTNMEMYEKFKKNTEYAKEELCWEKERKVLEEAYRNIFDGLR